MNKARIWIALAIMGAGLAGFLYYLMIEHDPITAASYIGGAWVVAEIVRPGYDAVQEHKTKRRLQEEQD